MKCYDRAGNEITPDQWASLHTVEYKRVGYKEYEGGVSVSTVWLGLDHSFGRGVPVIFETMIFGPDGYPYDQECMRYTTEGGAAEGHKRTCDDVERGVRPWFLESVVDEKTS